jgi:peptidoglycan hydrolase-like protein with peptidoglycan-binding domain
VRRGLVIAAVLLSTVPAAGAARTQVAIHATPTAGQAPLQVAFAASEAVAAHWDFGDGGSADGLAVDHVYAAGQWIATATLRAIDGTTATRSVTITAYGLTLTAPNPARWGRPLNFGGAVIPAERGIVVTLNGPNGKLGSAKTSAQGAYLIRGRVRAPGAYTATSDRASSAALGLRVVPKLVTGLAGGGARGSRYFFTARLAPARAGTLAIKVTRGSDTVLDQTFKGGVRIKLDTRRLTTYSIRVDVVPNEGYAPTARVLRANVVLPRLVVGARSAAVAQLGDRLRRLHYAAPYGTRFDARILDAVYAFQKVQGLPRTGVVDARFWRTLASPRTPIPRYSRPASHLEVNKGRQVLYVIRSSRVALIVPISTAGIAGTFTPVGRFAIYRKVAGFDPSPLGTLYDPLYFAGGYAIHGNPSVPPYPASHGCVRVPMWIAPHLYATNSYGETVYVY